MTKSPTAIFLDMDDTILADSDVADECWKFACERYAPSLPNVTADALYLAVARQRDWYWSDSDRHRAGRNDLRTARREIVQGAFEDAGIANQQVAIDLADAYT